ncbi:hypothetical protein [Halomonas caseinilytica]|uniref:hypothetical protein n=1 Tax=Halomonas caseinilytica TaxID=438744 RepID=UPI0010BF186D|nr:hypothetical protein [Halomonas caseinilytica]
MSKDPGLRDGIKRSAWEQADIHYIEVHSPLDRQALSTHLLNRRQSRVSTSKDSVSNNANSFEASNAPSKVHLSLNFHSEYRGSFRAINQGTLSLTG